MDLSFNQIEFDSVTTNERLSSKRQSETKPRNFTLSIKMAERNKSLL